MNSNCLEGIRCPVCGQEERFVIQITTTALVTDNGVEETYDAEWSDDSMIQCSNYDCEHTGMVREFRVLSVQKA